MNNIFTPTYMVKNTFSITPTDLKKIGVKVVFSDLDNTLVHWDNKDSNDLLHQWLSNLHKADIRLIIISNNTTARVKRVSDALDVDFQSWSLKPLPRGIDHALKHYNLKKEDVVMLGDQIMTDIIAANLAGVRSILVKPLRESDGIFTKVNRMIEKGVLKRLIAQGLYFKDTL